MAKKLYASFIGINAYQSNKLYACIHDVLNLDRFLRKFCAQQPIDTIEYHPAYWLAPHDKGFDQNDLNTHQEQFPDFEPDALPLPTYANIKGQINGPFAHLKQAQAGDICLLFYSGHGSSIEAPQEFWGDKSNRRNETMVCVDSRTNPEARDLIDKEMAYLIWDALHDPEDKAKFKDVHCLVIMDCCHSGSNFRDDEIDPRKIRFRHETASKSQVRYDQYLGKEEGFFELNHEGRAEFAIAPYVHLAAARDDEKAQETFDGGLFTSCLMRQLQAGGTSRTYRDLMSNLAIEVRNRSDKQNPVAFAFAEKDLDQQFLSREITPYRATYPVNFINGEWILSAGKIDGLVASGASGDTLVQIPGVEELVKVVVVRNDQSVLDGAPLMSLNQNEGYEAVLKRLANSPLRVGLSAGLRQASKECAELQAAYEIEPPLFYTIDFLAEEEVDDYVIRLTIEGEYVLTKNNSSIPLFKRSNNPFVFLRYVDSVGKWVGASVLKNESAQFSAADFLFTLEKIEGEAFGTNPDAVPGEKIGVHGSLPEELVCRYKNGRQPAFRLSIAINPTSNLTECYLGVLYLRSLFGIKIDFIDLDQNKLVKDKESLFLKLKTKDNRLYKTIPFVINKAYEKFNINEITAYLKIFVAVDPQSLALQRFQQADLPLDENIPNYRGDKSGDDGELGFEGDSLGEQRDWTVFTMKIRVVGPNKEQQVQQGTTDFTAFTLKAPEGFQAIAYALTGDDQQHKLKKINRLKGVDRATDAMVDLVTPPERLFCDVLTSRNPFPAGLSSASDNGVQILELRPTQGSDNFPRLQEGQKLTIVPKGQSVRQRSMDDADEALLETTLPYGYDEKSGLFYPLGYGDEQGNIYIEKLPPPSDGLIEGDKPLTKGIGQSIKLYFKKVFTRKPVEVLRLHWQDVEGNWQSEANASEIQFKLKDQINAKIVLAIHGITGDTNWMLAGLQELHTQGSRMDFILTYDYESLATPIENTAKKLFQRLTEAGFGEANSPKLTIVAHSMGGLITRHMLEIDQKGEDFIQHLIMMGTPNDGSEVAGLREQVFGLITDALNVGGVMKLAISGLSYVLSQFGANATETLAQLTPGSPVLKALKRTEKMPTQVRYSLIAGNISKITEAEAAGNPFLERLVDQIKGKAVYPVLSKFVFNDNQHDMAVTIDSMVAVPGFERGKRIEVCCDHVGYFDAEECLKQLKDLLSEF
ncbi:caspase family protein [Haliscomenobacter sp.]|uniref:caspase family protein n=1 Tax=Haliscomenobacter sp. TaxID=2717303 RepID=UPI0035930BB7